MTNPLIPRLREGEGADRELDKAIFDRWGWSDDGWEGAFDYGGPPRTYVIPEYTSSLDACIALAEKVLPGRGWTIGYKASKLYLDSYEISFVHGELVRHHNLCHAFLIALITAKEAEHDR